MPIVTSVGGGSVGTQLDYVEKTSNTVSTGAAATIITGNAVTYSGATRVKIEFGAVGWEVAASGASASVNIYEGATDLGALVLQAESIGTGVMDTACYGVRFLTPAAGSHTYLIQVQRNGGSGNVTVFGGAGGVGTAFPAWYRVTVA